MRKDSRGCCLCVYRFVNTEIIPEEEEEEVDKLLLILLQMVIQIPSSHV